MAHLLPYDVWECISHFIPQAQLQSIYSVNEALYHLSMNARYRKVEFVGFDDYKMRYLERLRDPEVACRVRAVRVETWAVFTSHHKRGRTIWSSDEIIHGMILAVGGMPNVTSFEVIWKNHLFNHDLLPFFSLAWQIFGNNLERLHLSAPLARFQTLLSTSHRFRRMKDLSLVINDDNFPPTGNGGNVQRNVLGPLVDGMRSTLTSLSVRAAPPLNLSTFFSCLTHFTFLSRVSLAAGVNEEALTRLLHDHHEKLREFEWYPNPTTYDELAQIDDTMESLCRPGSSLPERVERLGLYLTPVNMSLTFVYIGRTAASLRHLRLEGVHLLPEELKVLVNTCRVLYSLSVSVQAVTAEIIELLACKVEGLKDLTIQHQSLGFDAFDLQKELADPQYQTATTSLEMLDIKGSYLPTNVIQGMLDAFIFHFGLSKRSLHSLSFDAAKLNPQLVDYLARRFPHLTTLWIRLIDLGGEHDDASGMDIDHDVDRPKKHAFVEDMKKRRYDDWKLEEVRITSTYLDAAHELQSIEHAELVDVLASCIPSIEL